MKIEGKRKIDGKYEEVGVLLSDKVIKVGAAYKHLMDTCGWITPEIALGLLTLINGLESSDLYGMIEKVEDCDE